MADVDVSVTVASSVADAFAYVSDLTRLPEWDSSVRSAALAVDRGPALGRTFDVVVGFYGKQLDATYEISEFVCDEVIGWTIDGRADGSTRVEFTSAGAGCTISYRTELKMHGFAKLLDRGLKAALEGIGENVADGLTKQLGA